MAASTLTTPLQLQREPGEVELQQGASSTTQYPGSKVRRGRGNGTLIFQPQEPLGKPGTSSNHKFREKPRWEELGTSAGGQGVQVPTSQWKQ